MLEMLKTALPYALLAMLALWSLSLQREVASLENANAALTASFEQMSAVVENNDRAVAEWAEAHDANAERMELLHVELGKVDDPVWGDMRLPDEYVRVLREAGILDGGCDAAGDSVEGSGSSKADGNDEQGAVGVRSCVRSGR